MMMMMIDDDDNLEAQAQVPLHIPAGQAQVLIAVQAGGEPGVMQGLSRRQSLAWVSCQQLPHQALRTARHAIVNCVGWPQSSIACLG